MKNISDWQAVTAVLEKDAISEYEIYKACVSFSINGATHAAECDLPAVYKLLLESRRCLKADEMARAIKILQQDWHIDPTHPHYYELSGDQQYLMGLIWHRQNSPERAEGFFERATQLYDKGKDTHRALRSLINQKICNASSESYIKGEIFFLKQRAFSLRYHDLVGNIEKAAACELLCVGEYTQAKIAAQSALTAYQLDGCPEDRAVATALLGIAHWITGDRAAAAECEATLQVRDGKVKSYLDILNALLSSKRPKILQGHPLDRVNWSRVQGIKKRTISGTIVERLKLGPAGRDELIQHVWGEKAIEPYYCNRLHSAINDLRTRHRIRIEFDGQNYSYRPG